MTLYRLIFGRLLLGVVTLFAVSVVISGALALLPGDFAQAILGQSATPEAVAAIRAKLGLDQPFHIRYLSWLGGVLTGDLGVSLTDQRPVAALIGGRLANTLFLAALAAVMSIPLSLLLGLLAALYRKSVFDRATNIGALASISSPEFVLGYILILLFAVQHQWFSPISTVSPNMALSERLWMTFLPALTLTMVVTAHMMRMTRAAIINLLSLPYIEMARLKGMSPWRVVFRHAMPNALAPIINVISINLAYLITGVVVVEVVFAYPGVGQLFVDSVSLRNVPIVQACCIIFATAYILLNLIADIVTIVSNPRLRHPK